MSSLNNNQMLPPRTRNMRQMQDVLNAEDVLMAEIEQVISAMYQRASLLHEELVNEAWLEDKLSMTSESNITVINNAEQLCARINFDMGDKNINVNVLGIKNFLNKWLPAHLMYQIVLWICHVISVEHSHTGRIIMSDVITISGSRRTQMVMRIHLNSEELLEGTVLIKRGSSLDGSELLDGSAKLNAISRKEELQ